MNWPLARVIAVDRLPFLLAVTHPRVFPSGVKCWVGVTHYADKHVWIKEYRNNDEVVAAVMGSCHLAVRSLPSQSIWVTTTGAA